MTIKIFVNVLIYKDCATKIVSFMFYLQADFLCFNLIRLVQPEHKFFK